MYPSHIITMAKTFVHENISSSSYDDTELVRFLNDGVRGLVSEVRNSFPTFGMQSTTVTQTSGTEATDLPANFDRIIQLRDNSDHKVTTEGVDIRSKLDVGFALTDTQFYWVNRDESRTWELWYTQLPIDVHIGVGTSAGETDGVGTITLATAAAATTFGDVRYGKAFDDYYNGAWLYIRDCDTAAREHQKVLITDYNGSTRVATFGAWPSDTPDGTVTYEILPMIDCVQFGTLLAWEVALRILVTSRDDTIVQARRHPYAVERKAFKAKWRKMQAATHAHIRFRSLESQA